MKYIKLTNSPEYLIVDDEDWERCRFYGWSINRGKQAYAYTNRVIGIANFIMQSDGMFDHKDNNRLNNQKSNLRPCTNSQNLANRPKFMHNTTSKYKGVSFRNRSKPWRAVIMVNEKQIYLGSFSYEKAAALAYNRAALRYFGEFARLNEVE